MTEKTKKKYFITIIGTLLILIFMQAPVYAKKVKVEVEEKEYKEATWVGKAFAAARNFLTQSTVEVPEPVGEVLYNTKMTIRGFNRALWVLLAGISAIALSIVGIRYILGINISEQRKRAKEDLHKIMHGMVYGFGAVLIFNIAMSIVRLIIENL